jgi:hypothetical protein
MKLLFNLTLLLGSLLLVSCASQSEWSPTVNPDGNPNANRLDQDLYECKNLASQVSDGTAKRTAASGFGGAALGAIAGNAGTKTAIGATDGGGDVADITKQDFQTQKSYKSAYANCMQDRGHHLIN